MSLSPSDDGDRKRLASSIDEEGISTPARMYEIDGRGYKVQTLNKAIRLCGSSRLRISEKEPYDLVNDTVYVASVGVIRCVDNELHVRGVWKPCTITLRGDGIQTLHKSYATGERPGAMNIAGYTSIQVESLKPYHGPTRTLSSISDLMVNYSAATDVVAYKIGPDLYNVAFACENKWKCIVCHEEFDRPIEWADHYAMTVELPYGANTWRAVHINVDKKPTLSRIPYKGGICCPVRHHEQGSMNDKKLFWTDKGELRPCPRKMWAELMSGMESNITVTPTFRDEWRGVQFPTWETVGEMIKARVREARDSWERTIQRGIWNDWKPDPRHANGGTWVRVGNSVGEFRKRAYREIRRMDDKIVMRQGRPTRWISETKDKVHLEFDIHAADTVWDVKTKIVKYRRTPPMGKLRLYYKQAGQLVLMLNGKTMDNYGVKGSICGYDVWLGRFNGRIEEPPDELRKDVVTNKTLEYTKRFLRR